MTLCPFCGDSIEKKGACPRETCSEASARIPLADVDSRGFPVMRKTWQPEGKRVRKAHNLRILPSAWEDIRRAATAEQLTMSDFVERWALSLRE